MTPARATIVLPLDGAPEQALRCLAALSRLPEEPLHEVVIVDDASVGLEELLARLDGDVAIARTPARLGFAGAAAVGAERATGDVVVFVMGAAEVEAGWLAPLVGALDDPACAAAASATAGAPDLPAVAAHAIAVRRTDLEGIGGVPAAPAGLEVAALCATLARRGSVDVVARSVVRPSGGRSGGARRYPDPADPGIELSIVIPTLDAASERLRRCVAAAQATTDCAHEIVVIDNGAPPQGFTAPVNAGLRAARGRFMVVLNDDVELLPGWWPPLRAALDSGQAVVFPLTIDGAMRRDFAAWCFALRRATLERFEVVPGEFLDPSLVVWFQDTDLLDRLRAAGMPPVCVESSRIRHGLSETVETEDPQLRAWIREQVARDKQRYDATRVQASVDGPKAAA
jgi:GT2 family glycosyltransferase